MRKIIVSLTAITLVATTISGCAPGQNTPGATVIGAAAGGLLAGSLFHGQGNVIGIMAGTLIGGSLGYIVGRQMDRQDQINMQNAITTTPVGSESAWTNRETNVTYQVRPVKNYHSQGCYCREYRTRVNIGGEWKSAYGKACRMPDGAWKIVK